MAMQWAWIGGGLKPPLLNHPAEGSSDMKFGCAKLGKLIGSLVVDNEE